jgi:acetyltransferase-like isoleucine patch superfamily enzyme
VRVRVDAAFGALLAAGAVVKLELPRYAMTAGKPFLIVAVQAEYRTGTYNLTLWG